MTHCFFRYLVCTLVVLLSEVALADPVQQGRVSVVCESPLAGDGAGSPERIVAALQGAGFDVTQLKLVDLLDPSILDKRKVDVLVLPDAPHYPAKGRDALVAYLKQGGSFLALGGYAFDKPIAQTADGWKPVPDPSKVKINTRFGQSGDIMWTSEDQIGVFDPSYPLRHATQARTAPDQYVLKTPIHIEGELQGYAATAMTGKNHPVFPDVHARWIPLVNTYDVHGRLRGAAAALVHHYAGPFKGSSGAFAGVTNRDVIGDAAMLPEIIGALVKKTFLHNLTTDWACYRPGEPVELSVNVANYGPTTRTVDVELIIEEDLVFSGTVKLGAGEVRKIQTTWRAGPSFDRDYYNVTAILGDERLIDEMQTAFVVWNEKAIASGPQIKLRDNYFTIDGRAEFLTGTNTTGMVWYCDNENPLVWDRDFAKMRDNGLRLLRVLHFSSFAARGYEGIAHHNSKDLAKRPPEKLIRQTDALVQLAQKHGIVFWLTLHDWLSVDLSQEELDAQRDWNRFWTDRYKNVPGIIYDVQNEPSIPLEKRKQTWPAFNDYLKKKYGNIDRLRRVWRLDDESKGFGDFEPVFRKAPWNDVRDLDVHLFKFDLLDRWARVNAEGVLAGDPDTLLTVGYLSNMAPADKILGVEHTSFSNMHWYGPVDAFPLEFKLIDRRFAGKAFSLGEFGAQEAHGARTRGKDYQHATESVERYLATVHYVLGLGGSFAADWCWKDYNDCIFPWGLNHSQDLVSKDNFLAFRAMNLLFQRFEPRYDSPELYLLVPDSHRLGSKFKEVHDALHNCVQLLLQCHVPFNVINEFDLDQLPESAKAIVYPVPYCPRDETFDRVVTFVEAGGRLYFSGDIAYDEIRQRTCIDRFRRLKLNDPGQREPLKLTANTVPAIQKTTVGQGHVFYCPEPLEVEVSERTIDVYRDVLRLAGVGSFNMKPDLPGVHAFSIPTVAGGHVDVLFNTDQAKPANIRLDGLSLTLAPHRPGLAWVDGKGHPLAVEAGGAVSQRDGVRIAAAGQFMIIALDHQDLAAAKQLLFIPIDPGTYVFRKFAECRQPVVMLGEIEHGQWRELHRYGQNREDGRITLHVAPHEALSIYILGEEARLTTAVESLLSGR